MTSKSLYKSVCGRLKYHCLLLKDFFISRRYNASSAYLLIIAPRLPEHDRASGDLRLLRLISILRNKFNIIFFNDALWERYLTSGDMTYLVSLQDLGVEVLLTRRALKKTLSKTPVLATIAEFYHVGGRYLNLIKTLQPSSTFILDTVDVHFVRERLSAITLGDEELRHKAEQTRAMEVEMYNRVDFVWTVSDLDREALVNEGVPAEKVHIVPNIHQIPSGCPTLADRKKNTLLFIGGFSHQPNVDAVFFFLEQVFPLILEEVPDAHLNIVGPDPPEKIRALAGENVTVTGFVPDTQPYLDSATVSIAPLRYGAGMKGKVGEALSSGLPLVTTGIGAQGMPLVPGRDCFVADQPKDFSAAVVRIFSEPQLWQSLSENGRRFMEGNFSFTAVQNNIFLFFENLRPPEI